MVSAHIQTQEKDGILEISLNRPERKNAFTADMYAAFADTLDLASQDQAVKVLLVRGFGGNFSTGNDLKDFLERPPTGEKDPVFRFLRGLATFPKPIVAAVEGFAVGVGTTMLLHADLVYAAENARFQLPFTNLGLVPEAGSSYLLPLQVGYLKASELCLLGDAIDAQEALRLNLVNEVLSVEKLYDHAWQKARMIAQKPAFAVQKTKELLKEAHSSVMMSQMQKEERLFLNLLRSEEAIEFMKGFFARKK